MRTVQVEIGRDKLAKVVVAPTLNGNGATKVTLIADYIGVLNATNALLSALGKAAPHGRDYQTAEPGSYERARREHEDRLRAVETIHREIEAIALAVQEQH